VPPDVELAMLAHPWKVYGHVLSDRPAVTESEASELDGRSVEITATTYESPWQGSCSEYARQRHMRMLVEIASDQKIPRAGLGLGDKVAEFKLTCSNRRSPPLTIYVEGKHAMTCWNGACYLLGL
jgi:hypothetical protein